MRILQVCPYAWDSPGGVQVHVGQLSRYLEQQGHDVRILAPAFSPVGDERVQVVGRPIRARYNGSVAPICIEPLALLRIERTLRRFLPDVVHIHEPLSPVTSFFVTMRAAAPMVATWHSNMPSCRMLRGGAPIFRRVVQRVDQLLAVSASAAQFAATHLGVPMPTIVPNGMDLEPFVAVSQRPRLHRDPTVVFVNRLDPRKGFAVMIEAFAVAAAQMPALRMVVAGDGPESRAVQQLAPDVRARVELLGSVAHADVPGVLARGDIFVAPALGSESFGMVLLEAMAAGKPIVASRIDGYTDVARDGVEVSLVEPGDAVALGRRIVQVLQDAPLRERLVAAGTVRVQEFAWSTVGARLEREYVMAATNRLRSPALAVERWP